MRFLQFRSSCVLSSYSPSCRSTTSLVSLFSFTSSKSASPPSLLCSSSLCSTFFTLPHPSYSFCPFSSFSYFSSFSTPLPQCNPTKGVGCLAAPCTAGAARILMCSNDCVHRHGQSSDFTSASWPADRYDVAIIGAGPGGYVCAIRCAQLGLRTLCVDGRSTLGGACLNVGCIPSKALLNATHKYYEISHSYEKYGVVVENAYMDIEKLMAAKEEIVNRLTDGIVYLFKKNKVNFMNGWASLISPTSVEVTCLKTQSRTVIEASNIVVATGSEVATFPGGILNPDERLILTSTGALSLKKVPQKLVVIGGGVIGLELGSLWHLLGADVEILEFTDQLCSTMDAEIVGLLTKLMVKKGLKVSLKTKVTSAEIKENSVVLHTESQSNKTKATIETDSVLVAIGRTPYTKGLNLEKLGIQLSKDGRIPVDDEYRVAAHPSIRAIGDVVKGPMLAHKAEEEGISVAEMIANVESSQLNYNTIPSVVYSYPELAGVGCTEKQLQEQNVDYKKAVFPFVANSRAKANNDTDGAVKILADASTDKILGAWIMSSCAGEQISELVLAMEYGASTKDIARTIHAHPTLSEAVKEACMAVCMKPIHL